MTKQERIDAAAISILSAFVVHNGHVRHMDHRMQLAYDYAEALEAERDKRLKHVGCSTCIHWKEPFLKCQYCGGENEKWEAKDE